MTPSPWAVEKAREKARGICCDCPAHHIKGPSEWFACRKCIENTIATALMEMGL